MTDYKAEAKRLAWRGAETAQVGGPWTNPAVVGEILAALEAAEKRGRVAGLREASLFVGVDAKDFLLRRAEEVERS